jgi:hypothetical protein
MISIIYRLLASPVCQESLLAERAAEKGGRGFCIVRSNLPLSSEEHLGSLHVKHFALAFGQLQVDRVAL